MQSKVTSNYPTNAEDGKKVKNKGDNEKQSSGETFELLYSEAQTFQSIGEFKKAISSYSKALKLKPGDKKCLIAKATCHLKILNAEKAFDDSNEIQESDPEYVKSLLIRADALYQQTQFEYALVFYHRGRQLRPEMKEFELGIKRSEEAINNAIGDNSGIVFNIPHDLSDFCDELDIQKKLGLSLLASSKTKLLEKSETSESPGGARKGQNKNVTDEKKVADQGENENEKMSKKRDTSSADLEFEADDLTLEKKAKMMTSTKSCKQLLGELYADKEFLESLLNEGGETKSNHSSANRHIRSLAAKELNFLGSRSDFWQQQKPLYSRKHEKVLKEQQNFNIDKSEVQTFDSISEELKSLEDAQEKGEHRETLEMATKLLKTLERLPNDGGKRVQAMTRVYAVLGKTHMELEQHEEALKWNQYQYEAAIKSKMEELELKALENIGRISMRMKNYKAALKQFQKLSKKADNKWERAWLMQEMGRCYFEIKRFKRAEEFAMKSLEAAREEYEDKLQVDALLLIGQCQEKRNKNSQAMESYKEALGMSMTMDDSPSADAVRKAIRDLEAKGSGGEHSDEGVDGSSSGDDNDNDDDCIKDESEADLESSSDNDFSLTSLSALNSTRDMSSLCGTISNLNSPKAKGCPYGKTIKKANNGGKVSKENKSSAINKVSKKTNDNAGENADYADTGDNGSDSSDHDMKSKQNKYVNQDTKKTIIYNITVKTGDLFTASARSNVSIVIYGKRGKTAKMLLSTSHSNPIPFEQGKIDKFFIRAIDVGSIKQIKVFHQGTQLNDGWFLEEMKVTSPSFEEVYSFYVHRWLNKLNDDGKTMRTLEPTNVSLKPPAEYRVILVSGSDSQLVNGLNVFIAISGKHLRTDKMSIRLNPSGSDFSGQTFVDRIKVKGTDVKQITKIRISLDNLKYNSIWHLEKVKVRVSGKTYLFEADKWFERSAMDGPLEVELIPTLVESDEKPCAIRNQTKSLRKSSNVKIRKTHHVNMADSCDVDRPEDDDGADGADSEMRSLGLKRDQKSKREDKCGGKKEESKKTKTKSKMAMLYTVEITTGNRKDAGTNSNVFIVLYGEKGNSAKFTLAGSSKKEAFQRGGVDVFQLESADVGDISKIKIGHDGSRRNPRWYVERVRVSTDLKTYIFKVNEWFDREMGDGRVVRFIKLTKVIEVNEDDKKEKGGGTQKEPERDKRKDEKHTSENNKVECSMVNNDENNDEEDDESSADDDKDDEKNDGDDGGDGKNKISEDVGNNDDDDEEEEKEEENKSECNNKESDHNANNEEKEEKDEGGDNEASYKLEIKTGKCLGAGTDAKVFVVIEGNKGRTEKILLDEKHSDKKESLFEMGQTNHFIVKAKDVGKVNGILIGHDDSKFGAGWFLEDVNIEATSTGDIYHFQVSQWFDKKEGDGKIERHFVVPLSEANEGEDEQNTTQISDPNEESDQKNKKAKVTYNLSVKTGNKLGSGTDSKVYIILVGKNKKTKKMYLREDDKGNKTFERNALDDFSLETEDVGRIEKIIVGHDGEKVGSSWFLDNIKIGKPSSEELYTFEVGHWLNKSKDGKKSEVELLPTSVEVTSL